MAKHSYYQKFKQSFVCIGCSCYPVLTKIGMRRHTYWKSQLWKLTEERVMGVVPFNEVRQTDGQAGSRMDELTEGQTRQCWQSFFVTSLQGRKKWIEENAWQVEAYIAVSYLLQTTGCSVLLSFSTQKRVRRTELVNTVMNIRVPSEIILHSLSSYQTVR